MKKTLLFAIMLTGLTCALNAQWVQIGADIDGEAIDDEAGYSVSMNADGTFVAI